MKVKIVKFRRNAEFANALKDVTPGAWELLQNKVKDTGNWLVIKLHDNQVLLVDAGSLAADHIDGKADIFLKPPKENSDGELRPDLKLGVKGGRLVYA